MTKEYTIEEIYALIRDESNATMTDSEDHLSEVLGDLGDLEHTLIHDTGYKSDLFKYIDQGNSGDGHDSWYVFELIETGQNFGFTGTYDSWNGTEYDSFTLLEPYFVTQYQKKN